MIFFGSHRLRVPAAVDRDKPSHEHAANGWEETGLLSAAAEFPAPENANGAARDSVIPLPFFDVKA